MHAGRQTTFWFDDWNFVTMRLGWSPHVLLYPHNEHFSLVPVLIYKVVFELFGLRDYWILRGVDLALNLTCGALLFLYARSRLSAWPAVALASCLVLLGSGALDLIWPFQIGFLCSLAAGLGAILLTERGTRRADLWACVLVGVALASSSQGLMVLGAVAIGVLWRPDRWRRIWLPGIPAVLYAAWYLKYGVSHLNLGQGIPLIPGQIFGGLSAGSTALTGTPGDYGGPIAVVLLISFVYALGHAGERTPRLLTAAALPVAFWVVTALARTGASPAEVRYIYPTAFYVAILAAEVLVLSAPRGAAAIGVAALLGIGALGNAAGLNRAGDTLRAQAITTRSALTAAELLGSRLDPQTLPDPGQPQLFLGRYNDAVKAYGSSVAWSPDEIPGRSAGERAAVDAALIRIIGPFPGTPPTPAPAACPRQPGGTDRLGSLAQGRLYVKATAKDVEIRLRRFGDGFTADPQVKVPAGGDALISLPADSSPKPWVVAARSAAEFKACAL